MSKLSILSYNVAGISSKVDKVNLFRFIKSFDIFCLYETHLEEKDVCKFEGVFGGYKLLWEGALRESKFGRAKEDRLLGIKMNFWFSDFFKFVTIGKNNLIFCDTKHLQFYLFPVYISINNWNTQFDDIENLINDFPQYKFVIIGDCNARIGNYL